MAKTLETSSPSVVNTLGKNKDGHELKLYKPAVGAASQAAAVFRLWPLARHIISISRKAALASSELVVDPTGGV